MQSTNLIVGIDPGVKTGVAIQQNGEMLTMLCLKIHTAIRFVEDVAKAHPHLRIKVFIEDSRQNTLYKGQYDPKEAKARIKGVGSINRDSKIWEDFMEDLKKECANVEFHLLSSVSKGKKQRLTKVSVSTFASLVGKEHRNVFCNLPNLQYTISRNNILNNHTLDAGVIAFTHQ